jgi:hypothetical protein
MVKKLFSLGFYDKNLVEKNLWASNFFHKLNSSHSILESELKLIYTQFYNTNFSKHFLLNNNNINQNLYIFNLFSFYETSYFWFVFDFFFFNNLKTNSILFNFKPVNTLNKSNFYAFNLKMLKLNFFLKTNSLLNKN